MRHFAQRVLQERGYRVLAFADPGLALEAATRDPAAYDALVTDVIMPAISGPALAERIASDPPGAAGPLHVRLRGRHAPGRAPRRPLAKPFSSGDLADAVAALFGSGGLNAATSPGSRSSPVSR